MTKRTSDAQLRANKKWNEENRERANYTRAKSSAKSFIKNKATLDDLETLEQVMKERRVQLEEKFK